LQLAESISIDAKPEGSASKVTLTIEHKGLIAPVLCVLDVGLTGRYVSMEAQGAEARCEAA
jgi:hypothetical protein